ncbi:cytochrome P450 [Streptomyces sp. CA-181903]|uniref:cytochrome P450 n=1 Tax=Streptomyces sp. CA-181903 TaxID=3240055 RepID=UPI003D8C2FAE
MTTRLPSHRVPEAFRDPDVFDPDLPGRVEHCSSPCAPIGFGGGRHPCPGPASAQQRIKGIRSVLRRAFDLGLASPRIREDRATVTHPPRQPRAVRHRRGKR